jgi:hypothetical protein
VPGSGAIARVWRQALTRVLLPSESSAVKFLRISKSAELKV